MKYLATLVISRHLFVPLEACSEDAAVDLITPERLFEAIHGALPDGSNLSEYDISIVSVDEVH